MKETKSFFLLLPRRVVAETFDSIATKVEWRWLITVEQIKYTFTDLKMTTYFLKGAPEL